MMFIIFITITLHSTIPTLWQHCNCKHSNHHCLHSFPWRWRIWARTSDRKSSHEKPVPLDSPTRRMGAAILFVRVPDTIIRSAWRGLFHERQIARLTWHEESYQDARNRNGQKKPTDNPSNRIPCLNHLHSAAGKTEGLGEDRTSTAISNHSIDGGDASVDAVVHFLGGADGNLVRVSEIAGHLLCGGIGRVPDGSTLSREQKTRLGKTMLNAGPKSYLTSSQRSWKQP